MEVNLPPPCESGPRIESASRLFRVWRHARTTPPRSARFLRSPEGGLGIPLAYHRVAPDGHAIGDWKRMKSSGM
jgi:hypothetical protein